ncbi:uncharacterized protein LOC113130095 [Mastacembelus armatus]|uniref:uncharacterized protein LOC113130095 n=1 Tax=Mastacembelus armatus TaxID=205130 RepID=UPI000E456A77|nr:uncharacterized protein LOC113130095 [Mastacembelus armatus]
MLVEMEKISPSHLGSVDCTSSFPAGKKVRRRKPAASKRRRPKWQVEAAPVVVEVRPGSPASSTSTMDEDQRMEAGLVWVSPGTSPNSVVILDAFLEDEVQFGDVAVTPGTSPTNLKDQTVVFMDQVTKMCRSSPHIPPSGPSHRASGTGDKDKCICCAQFDIAVDGDTQITFGSSDGEVVESPVVGSDSHSVSVPSSVRGSFHQGARFFRYRGVQCMAIALVALAKHTVSSVFCWKQNDLDKVLLLGDELYTGLRKHGKIRGGHKYLSVTNLPKGQKINGQQFDFEYGNCVSGDVNVMASAAIDEGFQFSLHTGLEVILGEYSTCLLTLCGNTCAIIGDRGRYAVVDSHSRSATGMVAAEGKSAVVYFRCFSDLENHVCRLASCFGGFRKPFELQGVVVRLRAPNRMRSTEGETKSPKPAGTHTQKKIKKPNIVETNSDVECVGKTNV